MQQNSPSHRKFCNFSGARLFDPVLGFHIIVGDVAAFFKVKLALNQIPIRKPVPGGEESWPLSYW